MKLSATLSRLVAKLRTSNKGFTMIELLIVIAILGILAVAVLSAINPVEQIRRGSDTRTRSDSEQIITAIQRYNAFQAYYPWQENANSANVGISDSDAGNGGTGNPVIIDTSGPLDAVGGCHILNKLADDPNCGGTQELQQSFVTRVLEDESSRAKYIYNRGSQGDSTYICFVPESNAFRTEAETRCGDADGSGLPSDMSADARAFLCAGYENEGVDVYSCLP